MLSRLSGTLSSSTPSRRKKVLIVSTIVPFEIVVLVVAVALGFDFMNGFHDAANSVATVVSTRVLTRNRPSPAHGENCHAVFPFHIRSRVPTATTRLRGPLQSRARDE